MTILPAVLTADKVKILTQDLVLKSHNLKEMINLVGGMPIDTTSQRAILSTKYSNTGPIQVVSHNGSELIIFDEIKHLPLQDFIDLLGDPKTLPLLSNATQAVKYTISGKNNSRVCSLMLHLGKRENSKKEVFSITIKCDEL